MDQESKERFDRIERSLDRLTSAVEKQGDTLARLEELVEKGFTAIKSDFSRMDERFDRVESRLDGVEGQLGRVETDVKELKVTVTTQYPDKAFLTDRLADFTEKIMERIERRLAHDRKFREEVVRVLEQYVKIPEDALTKDPSKNNFSHPPLGMMR